MEKFDVIVIGGGPAGLTAAMYAANSGVNTLLLDSGMGGAAVRTPKIENYPGIEPISGFELTERMRESAARSGVTMRYATVDKITKGVVVEAGGETYQSAAAVLCLGSTPRKLGLPHEDELLGAGVSYCATCDGNFFRGKVVAVAGSGKQAEDEAAHLVGLAKKVYIVGKSECEGAEQIAGEVTALLGNPLNSIIVTQDDKQRTVEVDGLFVSVGYEPGGKTLVKGLVETDSAGYILTNERMQTSVPSIFAAGDCVHKVLRQVVTAAADGAIAGVFAASYAKKHS